MSKAAQLAALIGSGQAQGDKNLIINGAMQVAQRSTSLTVGDSTEYKTLDRYPISINGTTAGRATMSQATDAPSGFGSSMKFDVTTADTSIGSGEAFGFAQRIEGQNLQQLAKGTSNAKACTLSFYAKGTAKTYVVETRDANSRQVSATYSVTTSWQRFEITIPADTTGTIANDNTTELQIIWWFHAGSDYTSGTLNTSWAASVNANRMVGCGSIFSSTDNELLITGIQLEVGDVATPFEHESFAETLQKCERYYQQVKALQTSSGTQSTQVLGIYQSTTALRTSATVGSSGTLQVTDYGNTSKTQSSANISLQHSGNNDFSNRYYPIRLQNFSGLTTNRLWQLYNNTNYIDLDAEL